MDNRGFGVSDQVFNWLRLAIIILAGLDWLLSAVLVRIHLGKGRPDLLDWTCSGAIDCNAILTSRYSKVYFLSPWPVPVAVIGLAHFTVVVIWLLTVGRLQGVWHQVWAVPALFGAAGLFASLYFLYVMSVHLRAWCGLCLSVHAVHLLLVPGLWILWLAGGATSSQGATTWQVPVLALLAGAAAGLSEIRYVQAADAARQADKVHRNLDHALTEQFLTTRPLQIPISQADPAIGPADAPHTVVVFEAFDCSTCAQVSGVLGHVRENLGGALRIVHKHFPLSAGCNPSREGLNVRDYEYACPAAAAVEAAWRLGGLDAFAQMRDLLFKNQSLLPREPYEDFARRLGLDVNEFNRLRTAPEVLRKIRSDACVGDGLGVRSTPAIFVDGRRLKNPTIQRGQTMLLDETLEHWRHILHETSFGSELQTALAFRTPGYGK
jgi:protein-disulfide isomerase/uncharacterized membrane protein